jgi:hypothetical protein
MVVAWGVIAVAMAVVLMAERPSRWAAKDAAATRPAPQTQPTTRAAGEIDVAKVRSPQLQLVSRYAVGAAGLIES